MTDLRDDIIKWPDEDERKLIASRLENKYKFKNCIMMGDSTLFLLAFEPSREDAPDYSGRKYKYSLTTMILNNDKCRIRYYLSG